jgi:uncharacterized protein (DUF58 family)
MRIVPGARLLWVASLVVLPACAIAGFASGMLPLCMVALALCVAAAGVDAVLGLARLDALELRIPEHLRITKDLPAALPVTLQNNGARALAIRLGVSLPAGVTSPDFTKRVIAAPGQSLIQWPCTGAARGDHALRELQLEAASPLGLWLARAPRPVACTFRVYPNLRDRSTAALFQKTAAAGLRLHRQIGKGREFDNLRQYMSGDSFEDIHWKATARRGYPAVKLYRVEHAQEVYAVIDSSRLSMRDGILESYVNAALHLALVAERNGDRFGLVTFSDRTHKLVRARNGMDHFRLCRETIYNLRSERVSPDFREVFTSLQLNLRRRSLLIFFTSLDDALLSETFEREVPLLARRHLVLVNVMQTPGMKPLYEDNAAADLDALYGGLAGQMLWNRMRRLQIALQNHGVKLTIVDPVRIKTQVTSEYLEVKRRQAL